MRETQSRDSSQAEAERSALLGDAERAPCVSERADVGQKDDDDDDDVPNVPVSVWRGIAIGLGLGILVLLQGKIPIRSCFMSAYKKEANGAPPQRQTCRA
jgi:hypothetical protein